MIITSNQVIFFILVQILDIKALIVPDEVPSILSIIYSNIPTIKKGTDSRLGYGFRLGDRADIQFLVELGPQTNTQPLANQPDKDAQNVKRSPPDDLIKELYSKQTSKRQISNTDGGKWLEKWSDSFKYVDGSGKLPSNPQPGLAVGEIDAKSVFPEDEQAEVDRKGLVLRQLQEGRTAKNLDDESALLNLLKLMEKIQEQMNLENQLATLSNKTPNDKKTNNRKGDDKEETKKDHLIKQTARRIANTIQNASMLSSAVAPSDTSSKLKPEEESDDLLKLTAQKLASTVNNASLAVFSIASHSGCNEETSSKPCVKTNDKPEVKKEDMLWLTAHKLLSTLNNASIAASAVANVSGCSDETTSSKSSKPCVKRRPDTRKDDLLTLAVQKMASTVNNASIAASAVANVSGCSNETTSSKPCVKRRPDTGKDDLLMLTAQKMASTINNASIAASAVANVSGCSNETTSSKPCVKRRPDTGRDDLLILAAQKMASTINNASIAASAVANISGCSEETTSSRPCIKKTKSKTKKDDQLTLAAHKIASAVDNASSVASILANPPASMGFNEINDTVVHYISSKTDSNGEEKGNLLEVGAQRLAATVENASMIAAAFPEIPSQNHEVPTNSVVEQEGSLVQDYLPDRRRAVKDSPEVNNISPGSQKDLGVDDSKSNSRRNYSSSEHEVKEGVNNTKQANKGAPYPNEGFLQYLLRRLGYYEYLMTHVPVVPEATREKGEIKLNLTQNSSGTNGTN